MKILDHGSLELITHMGSDLHIVNAARQSFGQSSDEMTDKEVGLLNFLAKNRHGTPFEMVQFLFQVKCPLFVAREWFRHRIASYNEYSGRYTKMIPDFYVPDMDHMRQQIGKPGAYKFTPLNPTVAQNARTQLTKNCEESWAEYEDALDAGIAKEVARMHLNVNFYTQFTWSINLRSLFNFISLRSEENAMWEIRQYSKWIEPIVATVAPVAWSAFVQNGRKAP